MTTARVDLIQGVANIIADYRAGEIPPPDAAHVERWIGQFPKDVQEPLLAEMAHVLTATYINRSTVEQFLRGLVTNEGLAGKDHCAFWEKANIRKEQGNGNSQRELVAVFGAALKESCGLELAECGSPNGAYIYIDDGVFSGDRALQDLRQLVSESSQSSLNIHVVVIALYSGGSYWLETALKKHAEALGKSVALTIWRVIELENRKAYRNSAEVLWPISLPDDEAVQNYATSQRFRFEARTSGGSLTYPVFSSEDGRQLLEREMLLTGVRIKGLSNSSDIVRPLGYSRFSLGFGATVVTYRNCPNNCPLAWWWGDPKAHKNHPFSKWYPLLPRKTYRKEDDPAPFPVIRFVS